MHRLEFRVLRKEKRRKPLKLLGFQRFLSSDIFDYFAVNSDIPKSLENRLPKRHGGSNPSSCAKNEAPILAVGAFIFAWNERILTPLCDSPSRRMGFAYPTRRSKSSLFRRRVWISSSKTNTPRIVLVA